MPAVPALEGAAAARALRVLVVDDNEVHQHLVLAQLSMLDIVPFAAHNGLEAVLMHQAQRFDFILMDVEMPLMGGVVATARIREFDAAHHPSARSTVVVAHTASDMADDVMHDFAFDDVLRKPCDIEAVGRCLERCFAAATPSR